MRRYWILPEKLLDGRVLIDGDVFHHVFDVCRKEVGSLFEVLPGKNKAYLVRVESLEKGKAWCQIVEERELPASEKPLLKLALSVPRFPVFEDVIEKCVELGVHSIHPFFSEFSFVRDRDKISPTKWERWHKIIVGATQQSGRGELMTLEQPISLTMLLNSRRSKGKESLGLFAYEGSTTLGVKEYLLNLEDKGPEIPDEFWLYIGSEGGFSPREVELFLREGLRPITLGSQILRVETACVTLLGILKYHFNLLGGRSRNGSL